MDFEEIRNLVKLMGDYNLTEVRIESDNCNICFKRGDDRAVAAVPAFPVAAAPAPAPAPAPAAAPAAAAPAPAPAAAPAAAKPVIAPKAPAPKPLAAKPLAVKSEEEGEKKAMPPKVAMAVQKKTGSDEASPAYTALAVISAIFLLGAAVMTGVHYLNLYENQNIEVPFLSGK